MTSFLAGDPDPFSIDRIVGVLIAPSVLHGRLARGKR